MNSRHRFVDGNNQTFKIQLGIDTDVHYIILSGQFIILYYPANLPGVLRQKSPLP